MTDPPIRDTAKTLELNETRTEAQPAGPLAPGRDQAVQPEKAILSSAVHGVIQTSCSASFSPAVETGCDLPKMGELVDRLSRDLPDRVRLTSGQGGLALTGVVPYPWLKQNLEKTAAAWPMLVDLTGVRVEHPRAFRYRIQPGDTLSSLARRFLGKRKHWSIIYAANRRVIDNPHRLKVGDEIVVLDISPENVKTNR